MTTTKNIIKISSPKTNEFWEIPVLFEDEHLLVLNKPAGLLVTPSSHEPDRPNLMNLLHEAIAAQKKWVAERGIGFLRNAHRMDPEASGILLLAKNKEVLVKLANSFGAEKPACAFLALVRGNPTSDRFVVDAPLAPHPLKPGLLRVDRRDGKKARTSFEVVEQFRGCALLRCHPLTLRPHQIRVHLQSLRLPVYGDEKYNGNLLLLSRIKRSFRLKEGHEERPLISTPALHAESLAMEHPVTGQPWSVSADMPKQMTVAIKYLRMYSALHDAPAQSQDHLPEEQ